MKNICYAATAKLLEYSCMSVNHIELGLATMRFGFLSVFSLLHGLDSNGNSICQNDVKYVVLH